MGEGRNMYRVLLGKSEGRRQLERPGIDGRMGTKWTVGRLVGGCEVDSTGSGEGLLAGSCECGDEPSGSGARELVCHRLRVFEKRVLERISVPKRDEVTGECRKLHIWELHNLYSSPDIIRQIKSRRLKWASHVACMGEGRKVCRVLVGQPEGKRLLGRLRHGWKDGIRTDLGEIGWGGGGGLVSPGSEKGLDRAFVNLVMNNWFQAPHIYLRS
jgi:hypothetical protein